MTEPPDSRSRAAAWLHKRTPVLVIENGASSEEMEHARYLVSGMDRASRLPSSKQFRVKICGRVAEETEVADAHSTWVRDRVSYVGGLPPLPHLPPETRCPAGIFLVEVECIQQPTGGMSSYYGFEGTFVSLLVDLEREEVFDARAEHAT